MIHDFYTLQAEHTADGATVFEVLLNADCQVYQGHFPDYPVSPGVCSIQMIKECAERVAGSALRFVQIKQCRLTQLITPQQHSVLTVTIALLPTDDSLYQLHAAIAHEGTDCLTLKAELRAAS